MGPHDVRCQLPSRWRSPADRLRREPDALSAASADADALDALARLPEHEQELLRLAAWEGLAPGEIAVVLGCSVNAATCA